MAVKTLKKKTTTTTSPIGSAVTVPDKFGQTIQKPPDADTMPVQPRYETSAMGGTQPSSGGNTLSASATSNSSGATSSVKTLKKKNSTSTSTSSGSSSGSTSGSSGGSSSGSSTSSSVGSSTSYDPNVDYLDLIQKADAAGDYASAAYYEQLRNQKIADLNAAGGGTNQYGATQSNKYSQYLNGGNGFGSTGSSASGGLLQDRPPDSTNPVNPNPEYTVLPAGPTGKDTGSGTISSSISGLGTAYDPNVDYLDLIQKADAAGDYVSAAYYEQLRNQKIADLNAAGGGTNQYGAEQSNKYSQYLGSGYTSLLDQINGDHNAHYAEVDKLKEFLQQNPSAMAQLTQDDLVKLAEAYGIDPKLFSSFSQVGGYTQDRDKAIAGGGTGDPVDPDEFYADGTWYYYPGYDRDIKPGTSGADEAKLSDGSYALIQALSNEWFRLDALATAAKNSGNTALYNQYIAERNQCNVTANQIRNLAGYSGGVDGSMYIPNGQLGIDDSNYPYKGGYTGPFPITKPGESSSVTVTPGISGGGSSGSGSSGGSTSFPSSGSIGNVTYPSGGGTTGGSQLPSGGSGGGTTGGSGGSGGGSTGGSQLPSGGTGGGATGDVGNLGDLGNVDISPLQKQNLDELKSMLDSWQEAALSQQNGKIDYSVQQAIAQLQRALEDSQPQFKTMAESVTRDELQALDNSALYAELRGDKGGIGQAQYNSVQNAAAQNRLSVQQAQTKLATDTERQIADLRAQGEFQKADAALEITQQYLSQLMSLQQWAEQYNLSVDQFNAQLKQWEAEYQMALKQLAVDTDLAYGQLTGTIPSTGQNTLSMNQFLEQLKQWEKEYQLAQDQFKVDTDLAYGQLTGIIPSTGQNTLAQNQYLTDKDLAYGQLTGTVPSTGQNTLAQNQYLSGLNQWQQELDFAKQQHQDALKQWDQEFGLLQQKAQSSSGISSSGNMQDIYQWLADSGAKDETTAYNLLIMSGKFSATEAKAFAATYEGWDGYESSTVGLSPKFEYIFAQAQLMTKAEAEKYLKGFVTMGRKNGGITAAEMEYILYYGKFANGSGNTPGSKPDKFTPEQGI